MPTFLLNPIFISEKHNEMKAFIRGPGGGVVLGRRRRGRYIALDFEDEDKRAFLPATTDTVDREDMEGRCWLNTMFL